MAVQVIQVQKKDDPIMSKAAEVASQVGKSYLQKAMAGSGGAAPEGQTDAGSGGPMDSMSSLGNLMGTQDEKKNMSVGAPSNPRDRRMMSGGGY